MRWFLRRSVWTPAPIVQRPSWPRDPNGSHRPAVNSKRRSARQREAHRSRRAQEIHDCCEKSNTSVLNNNIVFDLRVMMRVSLRVPSLHCLVGDQSRRACPCRSSYLPLITTRRMKVLLQAAANQCRGILKAPPSPLLKTPPPPAFCGM